MFLGIVSTHHQSASNWPFSALHLYFSCPKLLLSGSGAVDIDMINTAVWWWVMGRSTDYLVFQSQCLQSQSSHFPSTSCKLHDTPDFWYLSLPQHLSHASCQFERSSVGQKCNSDAAPSIPLEGNAEQILDAMLTESQSPKTIGFIPSTSLFCCSLSMQMGHVMVNCFVTLQPMFAIFLEMQPSYVFPL